MTPPSFIPFEAMTAGEQREHLKRVHGYDGAYDVAYLGAAGCRYLHSMEHNVNDRTGKERYLERRDHQPHTHDKPARDRASQRSNG